MAITQQFQFLIGDRPYALVEVPGPLQRGGRSFAARFDHERRQLLISATVPAESRGAVIANAVSDACRRMWKPIPVIVPRWVEEGD